MLLLNIVVNLFCHFISFSERNEMTSLAAHLYWAFIAILVIELYITILMWSYNYKTLFSKFLMPEKNIAAIFYHFTRIKTLVIHSQKPVGCNSRQTVKCMTVKCFKTYFFMFGIIKITKTWFEWQPNACYFCIVILGKRKIIYNTPSDRLLTTHYLPSTFARH